MKCPMCDRGDYDKEKIINNIGDFLSNGPDILRKAVDRHDPKTEFASYRLLEFSLLADDFDVLNDHYVQHFSEYADAKKGG